MDERKTAEPFQVGKTLEQLDAAEWEQLCDGCGRCCLVKLEYEDEEGNSLDEMAFTDVACRLLDLKSCQCMDYRNRKKAVPECVQLDCETVRTVNWIPSTCAYRLIAEGKPLEAWHPMVSGDPDSIHEAGISVRGRVVSETDVTDDELPDHVVEWPR